MPPCIRSGVWERVSAAGREIGKVTSGTFSPTFSRALGMALVETAHAVPGARVEIDVRGRAVEARLAALPFYKRTK